MSLLFVRGIQTSEEDQRKIAMLLIPRQILFLPVVESDYNSQNAQFGLVMTKFLTKDKYKILIKLCKIRSNFSYLVKYWNEHVSF